MSVVKRIAIDGTTYDIEPTVIDSVPTEGSNNTVSSSGVKSYVDTNYVPLSATQAPVTGLTDILTPVNLLPNSDFSRSGGYAASGTITTPALNKDYYIGNGVSLSNPNIAFSNITYAINSDGSLTVGGTANNSGSNAVLKIKFDASMLAGKNYTMACNVKNKSNAGALTPNNTASTETIYSSVGSDGAIRAFNVTSDEGSVFFQIQPLGTSSSETFSITIYNCILCEGSFKNPPASTGLDIIASSQVMRADQTNISGRPWQNDTDCAGIKMRFTQNSSPVCTRIGASSVVLPNATGAFFDSMRVYSGMRRCNLADDGVTVNAYYGASGYTEDGSNGQVMVEIPAFYYRVIPTKTEISGTGRGTAILEGEWWVSDSCKEGFKLHPMFMKDGKPRAKAYIGAFEGSTYDVSASAYNTTDAQNVDFTASTGDKLASIKGAKPTSGLSQTGATRAGFRNLASNRGAGWHQMNIFDVSAIQMLMTVEYASFSCQDAVGRGVVDMADYSSYSNTAESGSTIGNASGNASSTYVWSNNSKTTQTADGKVSVSYRGVENMWGNIWGWMDGLNYRDVAAEGRYCYLASQDGSSTYADDTDTSYNILKFQLPTSNNYIKYFGYDPDYDFMFLPTTVGAYENGPVCDYFYQSTGGWRVARLGGIWYGGSQAGVFYANVDNGSSSRYRTFGGRLAF